MNRAEKAVEMHNKGYNCAQAVVCACCDLVNLDEQTAFRIAEGFGGGIGGMHDGPCGAVTGMYMIAGMKKSSGGLDQGITKIDTYRQVRALCEEFKQKNGSVICKELLKSSTPERKHSCNRCISDAVGIIEEKLV